MPRFYRRALQWRSPPKDAGFGWAVRRSCPEAKSTCPWRLVVRRASRRSGSPGSPVGSWRLILNTMRLGVACPRQRDGAIMEIASVPVLERDRLEKRYPCGERRGVGAVIGALTTGRWPYCRRSLILVRRSTTLGFRQREDTILAAILGIRIPPTPLS